MAACHDHPRYIELPPILPLPLERAFVAVHNWLAKRLDGMPEVRAAPGSKGGSDGD